MGIFKGIKTALFGGNKKTSKSKSKGTSNYDPWEVATPYLTDYLNQTKNLYANTPQFSPDELAGYQLLRDTVNGGTPAIDAAVAENNKTLSGAYLSPDTNPYLKEIATRMAGEAGAVSNSSFSGSGRTGSGLAGYYSGQGAAAAAGDVYNTNYQQERGRMSNAVGYAPTLEAGRYLGPQALISAGQNQSARPYDLNEQLGNIYATYGGLGQQGVTTGVQQDYKHTGGLLGKIANSFANKLFG